MKTALLAIFYVSGFFGAANAAPKNPDTYTELTIGDPDSLDPAWAYDTASSPFIANLYEGLVAFQGESVTKLEPVLATRVPGRANGLLSADGLTYAFPIRTGVRFHDGGTLTPEDVKYSLLRFMLFDRDGGPSSLLLEPILGVVSTRDGQGKLLPGLFERADQAVRVEGDKVVIRLARPFAPFLAVLATKGQIVSKAWCRANGAWDGSAAALERHNNPKKQDSSLHERANGTGPYRLERVDRRNKETVLSAFDGYRRGAPAIKRVVVKAVEEFATRKLMLQAGDADSIYAPQMMFPQLQGIPGVELIDGLETLQGPTTLFFTYKLNATANPNVGSGLLDGEGIPPDFFRDKDVRKAFAAAIDYDAYIRDVMRGKGYPARGFIAKGLAGYDPKAPAHSFDLAEAAERFKKAWGGRVWEKGFKCTLMYNDNQANIQTLAGMIKRNVESLNPKFKLDVRSVQWSTYLEMGHANKIPVFVGAWSADYPDSHNFAFPLLHSKGYYSSKSGFGKAEFDALIEKAAVELDAAKRDELYRELERLAFEEVPSVPIASGYRFRAQRDWIKGYQFNPVFPDAPYGSYFFSLRKQG